MKEYTTLDWKTIGKELGNEIVGIIKNQQLTERELIDGCETIGKIYAPGLADVYFMHPDYPEIFRVTNRKENGKKIGLFPEAELLWHNNGYLRHWRHVNEAIVALYCIEPGIDSVTSFLDSKQAYKDLPEELKIESKKYEYWVKFDPDDSIYEFTDGDEELIEVFKGNVGGNKRNVSPMKPSWKPVIVTHPHRTVPNWWKQEEAIYIGNRFMRKFRNKDTKEEFSMESMKALLNKLEEHLYQEKYMYHHHWQKGDLVFSDQFYSYHMRNEVKGDRMLYRLAFNYKNL